MARKVITLEVTEAQEAMVRGYLAGLQELEELADQAPSGDVVHVCEGGVMEWGRKAQQQLLQTLVQRRLDAAEKKGRRCDSVPVVGAKRIEGLGSERF